MTNCNNTRLSKVSRQPADKNGTRYCVCEILFKKRLTDDQRTIRDGDYL